MMWLQMSWPTLPLNFGMSGGSLVGISNQVALSRMGSLLNFVKSRRFKLAIKGRVEVVNNCEPTDLVGCAYEVKMKCGMKDGPMKLNKFTKRGSYRRGCNLYIAYMMIRGDNLTKFSKQGVESLEMMITSHYSRRCNCEKARVK